MTHPPPEAKIIADFEGHFGEVHLTAHQSSYLSVLIAAAIQQSHFEAIRDIDVHGPSAQAIIERWLIAYGQGEARAGDCKGILERYVDESIESIRQTLSPHAPEWGTAKPTVPGYYWWRSDTIINGKRRPHIIEVESWNGVLMLAGLQPNAFLLTNASGQFAGPLTPPATRKK